MRDNERKQTTVEKEFFLNFSPFFHQKCASLFFEHEGTVEKPTERERERERNDDADFVNPDFKHDDSDDEKNERGWSSK